MKKSLLLLICTFIITLCSACADVPRQSATEPTAPPSQQTNTTSVEELTQNTVAIVIELKDGRTINANLYPDLAPKTVENFLKLIDEDFYADLVFHRVIPSFMIQGGGMYADMSPKEAEAIVGEFNSNGIENPLSHTRGVLSMARLGNDNDSASSQFFIMHKDSPALDGDYAAFGKVSDEESLSVVDAIATVQTTSAGIHQDVPAEPIVIKTIKRAQ